jgi:hypothetical protein
MENGSNFPDGFQVMLSPVDHLILDSFCIDDARFSPDWGGEFEGRSFLRSGPTTGAALMELEGGSVRVEVVDGGGGDGDGDTGICGAMPLEGNEALSGPPGTVVG